MYHSTFNWLGNSSYDELEFEHVNEFVVIYESFFIDDEPEYNVFDFDMWSMDFIAEVIFVCDTSAISLDIKPLPDSFKYVFLVPHESLLVIIASDLD